MVVIWLMESEINKLALMSALIRIMFSAAEAVWSELAQLNLCCTTVCSADKTRKASQCLCLNVRPMAAKYLRLFQMGNFHKFSWGIFTNFYFQLARRYKAIF